MQNEEDAVYQRLNFIVNTLEKGNQAEFARRLGVRSGVVGDMFGKRRNKPSFDVLGKMILAYPQLRVEWLLTGKGEMLKSTEYEKHDTFSYQYAPSSYPINEIPKNIDRSRIIERSDPPKSDEEAINRVDLRLQIINREAFRARNDDRYLKELIREGYELSTPYIVQRAAKGLISNPYMIDWRFENNAREAWGVIRSIPIGLYPQYPFLQYFMDFADPYRKIAVFVEEKEERWRPEFISYQDDLLLTHGWKVFRISNEIANAFEEDFIPENLRYVDIEGRKETPEWNERKRLDEQLSKTTMDGFFKWLKRHYFSNEIIAAGGYE